MGEWAKFMAEERKEGEWIFSLGENRFADFEIGGSAPGARTIPILPLGGILVEEEESRRVSEAEKKHLLEKWQTPIQEKRGISCAKKLRHIGDHKWETELWFSDVAKIKTVQDIADYIENM